MGSEPTITSSRELCSGRRVRLSLLTVSYEGKEFTADRVSFGQSVVILPVADDGRVALLRQWRAAVDAWVLEAPAGRVEPGETPEQAAERELEEETGLRASRLLRAYSAYVSPGYSDEVQHAFIALGLTYVGERPEEDEVIRVVYMRPEDYLAQVGSGVADAKTVSLVSYYLLNRGSLEKK